MGSSLSNEDDKKKRYRRTALEIDRHYKCSIESCQKSYGSEGSLNQHIKLKHPELYVIFKKSFFVVVLCLCFSFKRIKNLQDKFSRKNK